MSKHSLKFELNVINNQVEYDVLIVGLNLIKEVRAWVIKIMSNSNLAIAKDKREYKVKMPILAKYAWMAISLLEHFNYELTRILQVESD